MSARSAGLVLARLLDDRVDARRRWAARARALLGQGMTRVTLGWFVAAFGLSPADRARLEQAMDEPDAPRPPDEHALTARYRSLSATEHHYVGADRCPARHRTTQVLAGTDYPPASYLFVFDTNTIDVSVTQGARSVSPIRPLADGLFGVDIVLLRPIGPGETATLSYESRFSYATPPEPEFRRGSFSGALAVDIRVEFHPDAVPRCVYAAEWDQLDQHTPSHRNAQRIEPDGSVHRYVPALDNAIAGFCWDWD